MSGIQSGVTGASRIAVVVIGRNEGERLKSSIRAIPGAYPIFYVDSASTDGSSEFTKAAGIPTLQLVKPPPLSAARGRNAGIALAARHYPELEFVQLVDGDCVLSRGWLECASASLAADETLAAVFGELREAHPEASLYNGLCEVEWSGPVGEVSSCGGIAMFRMSAINNVGGFDEGFSAGEEPDLCLRLRKNGWKIKRLPNPMGSHDADLRTFKEWWTRAARGGYAYAALVHRHGSGSDQGWRRQIFSTMFWGGLVPSLIAASLAACTVDLGLGLCALAFLLLLLLVQANRIRQKSFPMWKSTKGLAAGMLMIIAKSAQLQGFWKFKMLPRCRPQETSAAA